MVESFFRGGTPPNHIDPPNLNSKLFFPVETNDNDNQNHSTLSMDRAFAIEPANNGLGNDGKQGDRVADSCSIDSVVSASCCYSSRPVGANKTRDYAHGPLATRSRLSRRNAAALAITTTILGYVVVRYGGRRRETCASPNPE